MAFAGLNSHIGGEFAALCREPLRPSGRFTVRVCHAAGDPEARVQRWTL